jgi:hypothetical protein
MKYQWSLNEEWPLGVRPRLPPSCPRQIGIFRAGPNLQLASNCSADTDSSRYNLVMETVVRNVRELNGSQRTAAEGLVGHSLRENQQLVIQIVTLDVGAAPSSKATGEGKLPEWCNVYEGLSDAEIAEIEKSIVRDHGSRSFH